VFYLVLMTEPYASHDASDIELHLVMFAGGAMYVLRSQLDGKKRNNYAGSEKPPSRLIWDVYMTKPDMLML